MQNYKVKAGEVVHFTSGEYSDFGIIAHAVFRVDCDLEELARQFGRLWRDAQNGSEYCDWGNQDFIAWLTINGHIVDFDTREIHIGSYCQFEIGSVKSGWDADEWLGLD